MRFAIETLLEDRSGAFKLLLIGFLTLLLLIPLALVEGVIEERARRHQEVLRDIARQHGGQLMLEESPSLGGLKAVMRLAL